jgi:hypothetical protein
MTQLAFLARTIVSLSVAVLPGNPRHQHHLNLPSRVNLSRTQNAHTVYADPQCSARSRVIPSLKKDHRSTWIIPRDPDVDPTQLLFFAAQRDSIGGMEKLNKDPKIVYASDVAWHHAAECPRSHCCVTDGTGIMMEWERPISTSFLPLLHPMVSPALLSPPNPYKDHQTPRSHNHSARSPRLLLNGMPRVFNIGFGASHP